MLKNNFDKAMDYIDANIEKKIDDIKKGLVDDIRFNSNQFHYCLKILTNESLYDYIVARKSGRYVLQFFYLNKKNHPFAHIEFQVH